MFVEKPTADTAEPLQTTCEAIGLTCADGLMVMVKVFVGPAQVIPELVYVGVTTIVATIGVVPKFTAAKAGIGPVPDVARPKPATLFVQV